MFCFPKDPDRCKLWLNACYRTDLISKNPILSKNYKFCELHFEEVYICKGSTRKRLLPNANPTKFSERLCEGNGHLQEITLEEPPKKVIILSDNLVVPPFIDRPPSRPSIEPRETENPSCAQTKAQKYFAGPSTSKDVICEPLVFPQPKKPEAKGITPPSMSTFSTQTPPQFSSSTPRKQRLKSKIRTLKKHIAKDKSGKKCLKKEQSATLEDFSKLCDIFLDKPLADIIKSHAALKGKKRISHRYSMELKQFALTIYFLSPRAYNYLSKLLTLPTKRSLQRLTERLVCKPGLDNNSIFKALELKVKTMLKQDAHCVLCIDEISLKSNYAYLTGSDDIVGFENIGDNKKNTNICKNALVIMARGLYSSWKQPLAFFFVGTQLKAKNLKLILEECTLKLSNFGLNVEAISSDMGSNFIELSKLFGVTPENSEFKVGEHKLVYIIDPCHLIKATRNNLLTHSFHFDEKNTSWSFIEMFFKKDKEQFLNPTNFEKMKVSLASQVLSHTVASGMNTYLTLGALPSDAFGTIEVVERFNNLFHILNSYCLRNPEKFKNVYDASQYQTEFFSQTIDFLSRLRIINKKGEHITNKVKFHRCWAITINSVIKIWEKLSKLNFMYLKTRRINTDCLENFFGSIRQQSGNNINPTPVQFQRAFRKLFCQNYMHSCNMNCRNDLDQILIDLKSTNIAEVINQDQEAKPLVALSLPDYNYRRESIPTQNAFSYVCGYILKKALDIHNNCDLCTKFKKQCDELDVNKLLIYYKAFDSSKSIYGGLQSPPEDFIKYIYTLEKIFDLKFQEVCTDLAISHKLFSLMENIPCPKFPKNYVVKLFIRLKIFYTIKYSNRELKNKQKDKSIPRKLKILSHV